MFLHAEHSLTRSWVGHHSDGVCREAARRVEATRIAVQFPAPLLKHRSVTEMCGTVFRGRLMIAIAGKTLALAARDALSAWSREAQNEKIEVGNQSHTAACPVYIFSLPAA